MNCEKFGEQLGLYWELSDDDPVKVELNDHIRTCKDCAEQFQLLDESRELVIEAAPEQAEDAEHDKVELERVSSGLSSQVMQRIYTEDSWRMPVADRMYSFSFKVRRNITILIAFFLALFLISFIHFAFIDSDRNVPAELTTEVTEFTGLLPVASAQVNHSSGNVTLYETIHGLPVASNQDPLILKIGTDPTSPDYLLIFSILGMAVTILVMNWFSRIRS